MKEVDINALQPHEVCELMCVHCYDRWIAVFPQKSLLKDMVCKCGKKGTIIKTGQTTNMPMKWKP